MDAQPAQLKVLSQRLRAAEERWRADDRDLEPETVETVVGRLRRRRLHEWLGVDEGSPDIDGERISRRWTPAMAVVMDAAWRAWRDGGNGLVVWIGRAVWPYGRSLPAAVSADSVLIDPAQFNERLWAIDLALRSHAVTAVVADGSGLSLRSTRRLQLAAEAGRSLAMLARPGHEASQRSAAAYRWVVRAVPLEVRQGDAGQLARPRWEVELVRGKDAVIAQGGPGTSEGDSGGTGVTWSRPSTRRVVEWCHEGLVTVSAVVVDRAVPAKPGSADRQRVRPGA